MAFEKFDGSGDDGAAAAATARGLQTSPWKLTELVFDPIWPKSQEADAAPEDFRLGLGRTLRNAHDVTSLCSVFFTAWLAGDRNRFEAVSDPNLAVSIKALGVLAKSATDAFACRSKLLEHGNLISFNSPMVDAESDADGKTIRILAHAHLYDVADDDAFGQPTVHFALGIKLTVTDGEPTITQVRPLTPPSALLRGPPPNLSHLPYPVALSHLVQLFVCTVTSPLDLPLVVPLDRSSPT